MNSFRRLLAGIATRLHWWRVAACFLAAGGRPLRDLGDDRGRLAYSLMMCRHSDFSCRLLAGLIRRNNDRSAEDNLWLARMATHLGRANLALLLYRSTERRFPEGGTALVASSLRRFFDAAFSGRLYEDLSGQIENLFAASADGPVALTVVSARFLDLFRIWLHQVKTHTQCQPLIVALDDETAQKVTAEFHCPVVDVSQWLLFDHAGRIEAFMSKNLWILRVLVLRALLAQGHDVVSLDTDAVPVGSLEDMLQSFPSWDIVAQRDYSIPMDVARKFGFILCCGCMIIRSNERTNRFFGEYTRTTLVEMDDQIALNHVLAEAGMSERVETPNFLSFRSMGLSWLCPSVALVSRDIHTGSVVRHFHLNNLTDADVRRGLGLSPR